MCPIGLAMFFTFMTIAEGGGQKALKRKFMEVTFFPGLGLSIGIFSCIKSELLYLASRANCQFQIYAIAVTDSFCEYCGSVLVCLVHCFN
jgi:hypothetical protein